jgi:hypothetical protein
MKRIANYLVPVLGLIWMSFHMLSCRTLSTTAGPPPSGPVNGMLYYLPIGKITIKGVAPTPAPAKETSSENGREASQSEVTANAAAQPTSSPSKSPAHADEGGPDSSAILGGQITITVTSEIEADEEAGVYYASPQPNYIYEDEVRVTVNAKRLLSAGNVTTEDKTAEIVGAVASMAAKAMFLPVAAEKPQPFNFSFHPCNYHEVDFVKDQLLIRGIGLTVKMDGRGITKDVFSLPNKEVQTLAPEIGKNGLIFRPAASYKIGLIYPVNSKGKRDKGKPEKDLFIKNTQQFLLPDPTKLYAIEYRRMAFVKKVKDIGFTDGMLTDYHQKVPSPILGFIGIPKAVVDALVPIPGAPPQVGSASASGTTSPKN